MTVTDPIAFPAAGLLVGPVAAPARYLPGRGAALVDPVIASRCD